MTPVDPNGRLVATDITIACPIEEVWLILTDYAGYPDWNPAIAAIEGEARAGERIAVHRARADAKVPLVQPIDVVSLTPYTMRWRGGWPDRSEFAGDHWFVLSAFEPCLTRLSHFEIFTGSRLSDLVESHEATVIESFHAFNDALKARCEAPR